MADSILCEVEGCNNSANAPGRSARNMCVSHYLRWRRHGDPLAGGAFRKRGRVCDVEGCSKKHHAHGYCQTHLARFKAYGDPNAYHEDYRCCERWIEKHKSYQGNDCIEWPFSKGDRGRGVVGVPGGGKSRSAPRAMCIAAHGEPPTPEHQTAHSCGNGHIGCMNPKHLRWATHMENVRDRAEHGRDRRGEEVNTAKLTEVEVLEIRRRKNSQSGVSLAKEFKVSTTTISEILSRKSWAWLE